MKTKAMKDKAKITITIDYEEGRGARDLDIQNALSHATITLSRSDLLTPEVWVDYERTTGEFEDRSRDWEYTVEVIWRECRPIPTLKLGDFIGS